MSEGRQSHSRVDGTIDAYVYEPARTVGKYTQLELAVPENLVAGYGFGRFVMARCSYDAQGEQRRDWHIPLRRPLCVTGVRAVTSLADTMSLRVLLPDLEDAGHRWLAELQPEAYVNLLGPFGRQVHLPTNARQLLVVADPTLAPIALPAIEEMLDQGGRVSLILRADQVDTGLLELLPLSVEVTSSNDTDKWRSLVAGGIAWADSMRILDGYMTPFAWADIIRQTRLLLDTDFAQIYMPSDLLCCTGACLSCVVERANGSYTRSCIHGPIFELTDLVG